MRELENVIRRALLLAQGSPAIAPAHIVFDGPARLIDMPIARAVTPRSLSSVVQQSEAQAIVETLEACGGNRLRAARMLGISERTLRYRLASLRDAGIAVERGSKAAGGLA